MKKTNVILVLVCILGVGLTSCVKDNETDNSVGKKLTNISTAKQLKRLKTTSFAGTYSLASQVGHKSKTCGGKCKYIGGVWYHMDCQGFGNECNLIASIQISKVTEDDTLDIYYKGTGLNDYEPIEETTFSMPARSFYLEDENSEYGFIWLNIPEQELQRDEESGQFIYKDITFTQEALFENL